MDELQAAFLAIKLKYLDAENHRRREVARFYCDNINHADIILPVNSDFFNTSQSIQKSSHVWHLFIIRHPKREKLQQYLNENGIQTLIHYPIPPHKQLAYKDWNNQRFQITEQISNEVLSLPISPVLEDSEAEYVVSVLNKFGE
jgi:dTDP-4-amino-4,6-dideoxygalactose transaminase